MSEALQTEQPVPCELADRIRSARTMALELLCDVIGETCLRFPPIRRTESTARIERCMKSGAWVDAVLALIELELPHWQLRRLAYDEGEWHCALSRQRELPDWLDQAIEYSHADLSLAIFGAFVEAKRLRLQSARTSVPGAPYTAYPLYAPLCCDNFA
jgi:hypothetical protein